MKIRGFDLVKGYENKNINIPVRSTKNSAGYDIEVAEDILIPCFKGENPIFIPTGLKAYMQDDEYLMLVPRSSAFKKCGIVFPHSIGIVDSDYYGNVENDGHIFIQCINIKKEDVLIKKGERIAQAIFQKYLKVDEDISNNIRVGGIGSTDKSDSI